MVAHRGLAAIRTLAGTALLAGGLVVTAPFAPPAGATVDPCGAAGVLSDPGTCTYSTPGAEATFTVPDGVTSVHVVAVGGKGGLNGGFGATANASLPVSPGTLLYVEVAGNGSQDAGSGLRGAGVNGGGISFLQFNQFGDSDVGGGGGGASDVRTCSVDDSGCTLTGAVDDPRLIVAGGGGGGSSAGGGQGGSAGGAGTGAGSGGSVTGGTLQLGCLVGGIGGPGGDGGLGGPVGARGTGACANAGIAGTLGRGGNGGNGDFLGQGGGGGGGFYGGGGGGGGSNDTTGGGGGGGGSSYVTASAVGASSVTTDTSGTPSVSISWTSGTQKSDQTISFGPLGDKTLADSPVTVGATASSGLDVVFSSETTDVCTVTGTSATLLTAGLCTINADQDGDATYNPAPQVQQSFNVTQASQTISFTSTSPSAAVVGGPTYDVSASADSGLTVAFTIDSSSASVCSITGATVSFTGAGTCTINANQAGNATYSAAPQKQQSFAVGQTSQTITFDTLPDRTLVESGFTIGATASSGLTVSFSATTTPSVCSVSGTSVTLLTTGSCTIQADQAGDATYSPAPPVQQSFNVTQASQTISFTSTAPSAAVVGGPTYNVTATATSGLTVTFTIDSSSASVCSITGATVSFTGAGTCTINANQAGNATYSAAPQKQQSFSVGQTSQTITFGTIADRTVLQTPFTVSATATSGLTVTFTSTTLSVCTVSGTSVSLLTTGVCTIQADQAGDATYSPAPPVQQSFNVTQASQTISFTSTAPSSAVVGGPTYNVTATATSGLTVTFTIDSSSASVCSISGSTVSFTGPGTCTINANQAGNATYSAAPQKQQSFSVGQTSQTITFGALANRNLTQTPFTVSATASSGLTVSFSSTTLSVCTVSGTSVTLLTAGTCTIQADQPGNATYSPAPPVQRSFTVSKANQTVSFTSTAPSTAVVGGTPYNVSATASSGLTVTFTIDPSASSVCAVTGSTVTFTAIGTCKVNADQAGNGTYNAAATVQQSFTVGKGSQTITFPPPGNKTLAQSPFTASATASSGLPATFTSSTTLVCTVSGATVTLITTGTCTLQAAQAGNANYNAAAPVSQSFTVTKANQTISFTPIGPKLTTQSPVTLSATATSGLAVTFTSLTTSVCTISGSSANLVNGGTCTIQANQPGNTVYNAAPSVQQSFLVTKVDQTITWPTIGNKTMAQSPIPLNATASSNLAVTYTSLTTTVCMTNANSINLQGPGVCTVQASQAGNGIYNPAPTVQQTFSVTKTDQTINFLPLADHGLNESPISVSATASSGLPVSFTTTTPTVCTAGGTRGSRITLLIDGTCTVKADQAGNATYNAAPSVPQSFTVTGKTDQTISWSGIADHTVVDAPFKVTATASSGLPVTISNQTGTVCSLTTTGTVTLFTTGVCTLRADQAGDATWNPISVTASFNVTKANQTITFSSISGKRLSQSPVRLSASASSGLTVTFSSQTPTICIVSGSSVTLLAAGTCTIQADQFGDSRYNAAAPVQQSFAVKP